MAILLKQGACGTQVQDVQEMLNYAAAGGPPLAVDGRFGPKTKARVIEFQRRAGLSPDGIVGPMTSKALVAAVLDGVLMTGPR